MSFSFCQIYTAVVILSAMYNYESTLCTLTNLIIYVPGERGGTGASTQVDVMLEVLVARDSEEGGFVSIG